MGEWYYIGHYGQLGPLTRDQIDELVEGGVIDRDTYIWKSGMSDWLPAADVKELAESFRKAEPFSIPPPPPQARPTATVAPPSPTGYGFAQPQPLVPYSLDPHRAPTFAPLAEGMSDKSRVLAGVLQLLIPGIGRIYLGYSAIGVLQLVLSLCGVGWVWSLIDGVVILANGLRYDGYGRLLPD